MQRVVIVGAGLGGLRAAESLRSAGYTDSIAIVGDEVYLPYSRPPLSKEALAGGIVRKQVALKFRIDGEEPYGPSANGDEGHMPEAEDP
jgi:NADPH-dependent 2,4-dienoyl-CoA reductase/sulfur reductase-like enzyme